MLSNIKWMSCLDIILYLIKNGTAAELNQVCCPVSGWKGLSLEWIGYSVY